MNQSQREWNVLISAPYLLPVIGQYRSFLEQNGVNIITVPVNERLDEAELLKIIDQVEGVICGDDHFTRRVIESSPHLKVISKWGTGIDSIDLNAASQQGVKVYNTADAFTDPVADTVMGYVLIFARQLLALDRNMRNGAWQKLPAVSLRECVLGIVGLGNVGLAVARRAGAFGMSVLGNDVADISDVTAQAYNVEKASLNRILVESDFVSLNCNLNPTSDHLISEKEFRVMKTSAYLINTSRGRVVSQDALVKALQQEWIAGAALDVFENEPMTSDNPLLKYENCLLAPHNANSSPVAWEKVHESTINNLIEGLNS